MFSGHQNCTVMGRVAVESVSYLGKAKESRECFSVVSGCSAVWTGAASTLPTLSSYCEISKPVLLSVIILQNRDINGCNCRCFHTRWSDKRKELQWKTQKTRRNLQQWHDELGTRLVRVITSSLYGLVSEESRIFLGASPIDGCPFNLPPSCTPPMTVPRLKFHKNRPIRQFLNKHL